MRHGAIELGDFPAEQSASLESFSKRRPEVRTETLASALQADGYMLVMRLQQRGDDFVE